MYQRKRFSMSVTILVLSLNACGGDDMSFAGTQSCQAQGNLDFICGPVGSEDIASVPERDAVVVSGLGLGQPGNLYLINTVENNFTTLAITKGKPDAASDADCVSPPEITERAFSGLDLVATAGTKTKLYAVNAKRNAVEIFYWDTKGYELEWAGCAKMPDDTKINGVAAFRNGDILVTSFFNPQDPAAWEHMASGNASGSVYRKNAGEDTFDIVSGLREISGPNGLELAEDEKTIYVSAWSAKKLVSFNTESGVTRELPLSFMPDNISKTPEGELLVAGQDATVRQIETCGKSCPQPWTVIRVKTDFSGTETLVSGEGDDLVNYATGAAVSHGELYITARGDDRVVVTNYK